VSVPDHLPAPEATPDPYRAVAVLGSQDGLHYSRAFEYSLQEITGEAGEVRSGLGRAAAVYVRDIGSEYVDVAALAARLEEVGTQYRTLAEVRGYNLPSFIRWHMRHAAGEETGPPPVLATDAAPEGPEPYYKAEELPAEEAHRRLATAVTSALERCFASLGEDHMAQEAIDATPGLGKSTEVLEQLGDWQKRFSVMQRAPFKELVELSSRALQVPYFMPKHSLADELTQKAQDRGLPAGPLRGRDFGNGAMCSRSQAAAELGRKNVNVTEALCWANRGQTICPEFFSCSYWQQFEPEGHKLLFMPHEYLPMAHRMPRVADIRRLPPRDLFMIDESFELGLARHATLTRDDLLAPRPEMSQDNEGFVLHYARELARYFEEGRDPRELVQKVETFRELAATEFMAERDLDVRPDMEPADQLKRARKLEQSKTHKLYRLWWLLAEEKEKGGELQRIEFRQGEELADGPRDMIHLFWCVHPELSAAPLLWLNGSLNERLARKFFPRLQVQKIEAELQAHVTQVFDTTCSQTRLRGIEGKKGDLERAEKKRRELLQLAEVKAFGGRKVLVVTYKKVAELIPPETWPAGVTVAHFGSLRGLDCYKDFH
jgi:hypothetical protein